MKQRIFTLTFLCALLCSIGTQAQETLIHGDNLNIGSNNTIIQNRGNVIGNYNIVNSPGTLAVGICDTIELNSKSSVALGESNKASGVATMAFGNNVKVHGSFSMGMGRFLKTSSGYSITLGNGIVGSGNLPNLFLENSNSCSLIIGFKSTKPTLTVGPSPNDYPTGNLIDRTGKIAIGDVPVPEIAAKLHIRSDEGEDAGIFVEPKAQASNTFIHFRDEDHGIEVDNEGTMTIKSKSGYADKKLLLKGQVVITTNSTNPTYSLRVKGGILTDKLNIMHPTHWPDYVFSSDYQLIPLSDLRAFVNENHHLPGVPSENDIMTEGIEIGDMQGILLKKIEEMTLYILQQQEQIDKLEQRINELERN
jgi:hypothetical protein